MSGCRGCGAALAPLRAPGRERVWCSHACRKRTLYSLACEVCGRRDNGSEGERESYVCRDCKHEAEYGERNRRIFEAWERGEIAREIAAREDMTETAVGTLVQHHRSRNGEPLSLHRRRNRELWPGIERLWNEGATAPEIAARFHTTRGNVSEMVKQMRQAGFVLSPRCPHYSEKERAEAVRLYRSGLSLARVAERCGMAVLTVHRIVRQAGAMRSRAEAQQLRRAA